MDDHSQKLDGTKEHIWLRYATQFINEGRSHTIEMSVPLPIGASDETREQLLREAEKGLSHLISHVENRLPQILQRSHAQNAPASSTLAGNASAPRPANKPAAVSAPLTSAQSSSATPQVRESRAELDRAEEPKAVAQRSGGGVSMPSLPGGGSGNLSLPEFIQAIKGLGLNPRQAMDLLKVKSLATGLNLREALDRLHYLIAQDQDDEDMTDGEPKAREVRPPMMTSADHNGASINTPLPPAQEEDDEEAQPYAHAPIPIFDEELDPQEEEEDFVEPLDEYSQSLTPSERNRAGAIIDKLRESRGATTVSPGRLQVMHNVIGDQITEEQVLTLIKGIWGVTLPKRLKVDQVEALIYWAKEDDFVNEVEAVLMLLEEEG